MERGPANTTQATHTSDHGDAATAAPSLLALVDAPGGDMGAALLRLAHRAAAQHRLAAARQHQTAGITLLNNPGGAR